MRTLPTLAGVIRRRILVNYRVDPEAVRRILPAPFEPKLHAGFAIGGVCLIRLEEVRPRGVPAPCGLASENAAHRIAVCWRDGATTREGVYIPRRDSDSLLNRLVGGRLFPGLHHRARFDIEEDGARVSVQMRSVDGAVHSGVRATLAPSLPADSCFASLEEASRFFELGSRGYSDTRDPHHFDGIELETRAWHVEPLAVEHAHSSFFEDEAAFPKGSATFDCALLMRNVPHVWNALPAIAV